MKKELLKDIIKKKEKKTEFAILSNLEDGNASIFEKNKPLEQNFKKYESKIVAHFNKKKKWSYRRNKYFY